MNKHNVSLIQEKKKYKSYIYKIIDFLENSDYVVIFKNNLKAEEKHYFRFAKTNDEKYKLWGLNNPNEDVIYINLKSGNEIFITLIHEILHSVDRELSEEDTDELAEKIMANFSPKLFKRFLNAVVNKTVNCTQFKNMEKKYGV